jgi:hypothetical protein
MAEELNVVYLAVDESNPPHSYWDMGMIDYIFSKFRYKISEVTKMPDIRGAVVVIPARNQAEDIDKVNTELNKLEWCVVILTGDEESVFPFEKLEHKNMRLWVMSPKMGRHDSVNWLIGSGFRDEERPILKNIGIKPRVQDWFFAGQITHEIRENMARNLRGRDDGYLVETEGFGQGLEYVEYVKNLASAKFVPAPSGPESPDNFRLYEALEAGAIPIGNGGDYWSYIFKEIVLPFPITSDDWDSFGYLLPQLLKEYPANHHRVFAWWQLYKRRMVNKLEEDITIISGEKPERVNDSDITVIISCSPIPSHPSTEMLDKTIMSIRERLPTSEIIIMFDGVRPDAKEYQLAYDEFKTRMLWKMNNEYENIVPYVADRFMHQSLMTREVLKLVKTPLLLFVEHDTPLVGDTDFAGLSNIILSGYSNLIRLLHEAQILDVHKHLMLDDEPQDIMGIPMVRTTQWSQRPHLASTQYYQEICDKFWDDQPRFIEHIMYGICLQQDWKDYKMHIYTPRDTTWLRSGNFNGRVYVAEAAG